MNILLIFPGFIIAFIIVLYYEYKISQTEPSNKVHFYVARDKNDLLYLYLGKPIRRKDAFYSGSNSILLYLNSNFLKNRGFNKEDFKSLKWEDEPVEVFINMED